MAAESSRPTKIVRFTLARRDNEFVYVGSADGSAGRNIVAAEYCLVEEGALTPEMNRDGTAGIDFASPAANGAATAVTGLSLKP